MKTSITHTEYLQLLGLKTLAERHNAVLEGIEEAALAITGDTEGGHTGDMIYGGRGLDEALKLLGITPAASGKDAERSVK